MDDTRTLAIGLPKEVGRYEVVAELGRGAMGVVYRAYDTQLQRPVALKLITGFEQAPAGRAQMLREARASSALNHPNICTVYGVGEEGPHTFIVLEFLEGETLAARIRRQRLAPTEMVGIARQIADALDHAHSRNVVHGDLKGLNVFLTTDGRPKVLDFGLAKVQVAEIGPDADTVQLGPSRTAGKIVGTLPYMSPEVLRGGPTRIGSDLWALGVMIFEMAVGFLPFTGRTFYETSAAILSGKTPPLPTDVPPKLARVILRALSADEKQRFPDAASFRAALEPSMGAGGHEPSEEAPASVRSLVVLPLVNLSGGVEQDYFADGMTEAITIAIASVRELRVVSRTSAMRYKNTDKPLPEIARELRVDAVVEGSVLRSADRVRVNAQLIRGDTDEHMWAGTYDRNLEDILELQMEVSRAIVGEIKVALSPKERARLEDVEAIDPGAYESYMRGRHALGQRTWESLGRAISHFRNTIDRAPAFAPAYASLAFCYNVLGFQGARSPRDSYRPAGAVARRALKIDSELATAHISLGYTALHHDQRWREAADSFKEGLRLEPDNATAHHWYALYHSSVGQHDLALAAIESARDCDPLSSIIGTAMGLVHHFARRYDEAIQQYDRVIEDDPHFWAAIVWRAMTLALAGDAVGSMRVLRKVLESSGRTPVVIAAYGEAAAMAGHTNEAKTALDDLDTLARERYVRPYDRVKVLARLDEREAALDYLDLALAEGGNWLNYLRVDPAVDSLRGEERFERLVAEVYATAPASDASPG